MKTIAVDLDDTLNDFTETLRSAEFDRGEAKDLSDETYRDYLAKVRGGWTEENGLLSTEYSFFRTKIHRQCYERARARSGGAAFLRRLRQTGWRIVICTQRDLRRTQDCTRKWLEDNEMPFDHLFMAGNKIVFCKLWGIGHLVDDHPFNIAHGERHGVKVYYPAEAGSPSPPDPASAGPRPYRAFAEIIPWIQG